MDEALFISALLAAGIRLATPIALAALGETLAQRSGVINVGLEGIMLVGAFVAVVLALQTGSPWIGLAGAIVCGAAMGAVHAYFSVILKVEQIVAGIALLFLGLGLSGYGYRLTIGASGTPAAVTGFRPLDLLGWADLPVVGPILFGQHALVYMTVISAAVMAWMLRSTRLGVVIKAVGEYPVAAAAAGVNVDRIRFACVMVGGAFAGRGRCVPFNRASVGIRGRDDGRSWLPRDRLRRLRALESVACDRRCVRLRNRRRLADPYPVARADGALSVLRHSTLCRGDCGPCVRLPQKRHALRTRNAVHASKIGTGWKPIYVVARAPRVHLDAQRTL